MTINHSQKSYDLNRHCFGYIDDSSIALLIQNNRMSKQRISVVKFGL